MRLIDRGMGKARFLVWRLSRTQCIKVTKLGFIHLACQLLDGVKSILHQFKQYLTVLGQILFSCLKHNKKLVHCLPDRNE